MKEVHHPPPKGRPNGIRPHYAGCRRHPAFSSYALGATTSITRACVRDTKAGPLHDGPSLSTATVCRLSKSRPGETNAFTRHFFFFIRGVSFKYQDRHKQFNTNETRKFVTKTSAPGLPAGTTVIAVVLPCVTTITLGVQANYSSRHSSSWAGV